MGALRGTPEPRWRNWAGNQEARPRRLVRPRTTDEVVAAVRAAAVAGERVKAIGSGHSFSPAALTDGVLLDLGAMTDIHALDRETGRVRVGAGITLHALNRRLAAYGLAMTNLGDIDRQTLAGALATGTHGTGARFGGLATQVRGLELVLADGTVCWCDEQTEPELYDVARVGLGALGVVTAVELACEPAYALRAQEVPMSLADVLARIHELAAANDHFEFHWFPHTTVALTKRNNRLPAGATGDPPSAARAWVDDELLANGVFGLSCRLTRRVPRLIPPLNRLAARLLAEREYADRSHRVFVSPRRVRFVETEWAVPRETVVEAFGRLRRILEDPRLRVSFPVELRFAAADDVPLSTAYARDSAYLAVHAYGREIPAYFAEVADALAEFDARPHWGKSHEADAELLRRRYPRFDDFVAVRRRVDPDGRFTNPYLDRVLGDMS